MGANAQQHSTHTHTHTTHARNARWELVFVTLYVRLRNSSRWLAELLPIGICVLCAACTSLVCVMILYSSGALLSQSLSFSFSCVSSSRKKVLFIPVSAFFRSYFLFMCVLFLFLSVFSFNFARHHPFRICVKVAAAHHYLTKMVDCFIRKFHNEEKRKSFLPRCVPALRKRERTQKQK